MCHLLLFLPVVALPVYGFALAVGDGALVVGIEGLRLRAKRAAP